MTSTHVRLPTATRLAAAALLLLVATAVVVELRLRPPAPLPASEAAAGEFSAERAAGVVRRLLPAPLPHPVGSAAQERVRRRVVAELRAVGLSPEVETSFVCAPARGTVGCATVHNITATVAATSSESRVHEGAVLLVAHYDSVPAGPGASDDLSGVAQQVEVARALRHGPPLRRPVTLLVTDGEEAGLLGATAFAQRHDLTREAVAVVNLEARGTAGPTLMFETGPRNERVVDLFAAVAPHPVTTSLMTAIYEQLPHDTDFEVFTERGLPGVNLAVIEDLPSYHTPRDDLARVDRASMQHQGATALALTRVLAQQDRAPDGAADAVFFDVLALAVVRWPLGWTGPLAGTVLLLAGVSTATLVRRGLLHRDEAAREALGVAWVVVGGAGLALAAHLLLRAIGAVPAPWVAHPAPALLAIALAAALPALVRPGWTQRTGGWVGPWAAGWWLLTLLGVGVAVLLPEASYLLLVPASAAWLAALLATATRAGTSVLGVAGVLLLPVAVAALLWAPLALLVWEGLGLTGLPFGLGPAWLPVWLALLVVLLPLDAAVGRARRRAAAAVGGLAAVAVLTAVLVPPFTAGTPQHVTLLAHREPDGQTHWRAESLGPLPTGLLRLADWSQVGADGQYRLWQAPGPPLDAPGPGFRLDVAAAGDRRPGDVRRVVGELDAGGADEVLLRLPAGRVTDVRVNGQPVRPVEEDPATVRCRVYTPSAAPLRLELVVRGSEPVPLHLVSLRHQLPPAGEPLLRARPPSAVPVHLGDAIRLETVVAV